MTLEQTIGHILEEKKLIIGLAESCTGGLISHRITNVPGSSAYFEAGLVTYGNRAKTRFLLVPEDAIAQNGAVSAIVAELMAKGVRERAGVGIGLSTTGIAGPTGGSKDKPVGTVFMGLAASEGVYVRKHLFDGDRLRIKEQASEEALLMLLDYLKGRPL